MGQPRARTHARIRLLWVVAAGALAGLAPACSSGAARSADPATGVAPHEPPLALADAYGCVVRDGEARCWGRHPRFAGARTPERFPELDGAAELAAGSSIRCGRRDDGAVLCSTRPF